MALRDYIRQRPPIASTLQSDIVSPDAGQIQQTDHVATMDAWGIPDDLPVPISEENGCFVPATAAETDIRDWDPWLAAKPAIILDHSRPAIGPYGEPSTPGKSGSIVAEWGGMPAPVKSFQDPTHSVLYSKRQVNYHESHGSAGMFLGAQQNVYEQSAEMPAHDYWSTIALQAGETR